VKERIYLVTQQVVFLMEALTFSPPGGIRIPHVIQGAFLGIELMKENIVVLRILIKGKKKLTKKMSISVRILTAISLEKLVTVLGLPALFKW